MHLGNFVVMPGRPDGLFLENRLPVDCKVSSAGSLHVDSIGFISVNVDNPKNQKA